MTAQVVCAREDMTVGQLAHLLSQHDISGAPVLDAAGVLVGVVSMTDIVLQDEIFGEGPVLESDYYKQVDTTERYPEYFALEGLEELHVRDIMSPDVIAAQPSTPVRELAGMMISHRIHRLIIVEEGKVAGIVSTMDILRAVMEGRVA
jgi:CBS domain-containing protein